MNFLRRLSPLANFNEFFISWVYFVQGSASIFGIAEALILREQLGLDFAQIALVGAASIIPWSIKPLYGILTDLVPIGKYRRRPYLHFFPLLAVAGYAWIALFGDSFLSYLLPLVIANIGLGFVDVATDGFVVEQSNPQNVARLQGITQASIRVAAFLASFFSGLLIFRAILTPHQIFWIAAALPLLTTIFSFGIREEPVTKSEETVARHELTPAFVVSLLGIFGLIIFNLALPDFLPGLTHLPGMFWSTVSWSGFFAWLTAYFWRLKKMQLASGMIFLAMLFILLWRFNPGASTPMFFYLKDELKISEETLGFISTASQVASILAVILAVKFFDKFHLKKVLGWSVVAAGLFGISSFALTRVDWSIALGSNFFVKILGSAIALPVYFFEAVFTKIGGGAWTNFWTTATSMSPIENFLFVQGFFAELLFMIAYIPLFKLAVLITPKRAEATNFAVIAAVMNIGLALSTYASGTLYEFFRNPALDESALDLSAIEILIWINVLTSFACLFVLPFIREREIVK
ncbi:MAG: MFS transporter [Patescibacteria group bacterium]